MGNGTSLNQKEITELQQETKFSQKEIKRIHKRFRKLDRMEKGEVTPYEFSRIPEISKDPLGERITAIFSTNDGKSVDFMEFIKGLGAFNTSNEKLKQQIMFRIYDVNNDKYVDHGDLYVIMKKLVGEDLEDSQIHEIVAKTIAEHDADRDGKLNYQEFLKLIAN